MTEDLKEMKKECLMGQLFNISCDMDEVENEMDRIPEHMRFRREELKTSIKELENDKVLSSLLMDTVSDLNSSINTLNEYLSYFRDYKDDMDSSLDLCRRVAKGGIEDYETK